MRSRLQLPVAAALAVAALAVAGCGGGGGGSETLGEAKQKLIDSCHHGNTSKADLKLCQCIAAKLQSRHGYDTAKKFDAALKSIRSGKVPLEVKLASVACQGG